MRNVIIEYFDFGRFGLLFFFFFSSRPRIERGGEIWGAEEGAEKEEGARRNEGVARARESDPPSLPLGRIFPSSTRVPAARVPQFYRPHLDLLLRFRRS